MIPAATSYTSYTQARNNFVKVLGQVEQGDSIVSIAKLGPLKHIGANIWSRRINLEHRLVHRVENDRIFFLQARHHYQ
jgi:toxin YoeB